MNIIKLFYYHLFCLTYIQATLDDFFQSLKRKYTTQKTISLPTSRSYRIALQFIDADAFFNFKDKQIKNESINVQYKNIGKTTISEAFPEPSIMTTTTTVFLTMSTDPKNISNI
jgi:hypothetical protein